MDYGNRRPSTRSGRPPLPYVIYLKRSSKPLLDDLHDWVDKHLPVLPKQSALGIALNYMHTQWPSLTVYVEHGDLRIDNNLVENAIRPLVIGCKNFLFCNSVAGANATANLFSLIETARAKKIEPYRHLAKCIYLAVESHQACRQRSAFA